MTTDTYDKLRECINGLNDELIPYVYDDSAIDAILQKAAHAWDNGESFRAVYPNAFFSNKRESDDLEEWAAAVDFGVRYPLERLARKRFASELTREQAVAVCSAIAPNGKVFVHGIFIDADEIMKNWNATHPDEPEIRYNGVGCLP